MKKLMFFLGAGVISASAAQASEIDTCTTFTDEPPSAADQLLCAKEKQHAEALGLPASDDATVLSLNDLYELGWSLHSLQRFENANDAYVYRVYMVRAE